MFFTISPKLNVQETRGNKETVVCLKIKIWNTIIRKLISFSVQVKGLSEIALV